MLPATKTGLPRCLFLDQNKWIDLARAHYGRPDGEPFREALAAIRTAADACTLVVPFSAVNAVEAIRHRDPDRRERLARFMVELSGNLAVRVASRVRPVEILHALRRRFGRGETFPLRTGVIGVGLLDALGARLTVTGLPPAEEEDVRRRSRSPDVTVGMLLHLGEGRELVERASAADAALARFFDALRERAAAEGLTWAERRAAELVTLFAQPDGPAGEVRAGLRAVGVSEGEFARLVGTPDTALAFMGEVPTLDVFTTLVSAKLRDPVRPNHRNDTRDVESLSVAVPYADAVVVERYWGHQVRATGLARKYATEVLADLREVPAWLRSVGCAEGNPPAPALSPGDGA